MAKALEGSKRRKTMMLIPVRGHLRRGKRVRAHNRLVRRAMAFAGDAHAGQTRGDGVTPYIRHPEAVINVLRRHGYNDGALLAAAALHDVVEDTPTRIEEIRARFGAPVASIVAEATDPPDLPRGRNRLEAQVKRVLRGSQAVQALKLADKISNLRDSMIQRPPHWDDARHAAYCGHAEALARGLMRVHPGLARELLNTAAECKLWLGERRRRADG